MPIDTSSLFSIETINSLIVRPLFSASVALRSGLTPHPTGATKVYIPVVTAGAAGWRGELEDIQGDSATADELEVTVKKITASVIVSNESASDANAAALIGGALVTAAARAIDRAFLQGGGAKGPAGLPGVTGTGSIDADPGTSLDWVADAIAKIEAAGGTPGAIFMDPLLWAAMCKIKTGDTDARPVLNPSPVYGTTRSVQGVPVQVSADAAPKTAWVADTSRVVCVLRENATSVEADRSSQFLKDGVAVRLIGRLDFGIPYPATVIKVTQGSSVK